MDSRGYLLDGYRQKLEGLFKEDGGWGTEWGRVGRGRALEVEEDCRRGSVGWG